MFKKKSVIPFLIILCLCVLLVNFQKRRNYERKAPQKVQQEEDEIEKLNQRIKQEGLNWVAGETTMTKLSPEERRRMLGSFTPTYVDPTKFAKVKAIQQPAALDYRSLNGQNYLTIAKNQGTCGSCWTFGPITVMEAMYKWEQNAPDQNPDLSEQHLLNCSGGGTCDGGYPSQAAEYIKTTGVPPESCYAYTGKDGNCTPCGLWPSNAARINGWAWIAQGGFIQSDDVSMTSTAAIKSKLYTRGPLVGHMIIYPDFYSYTSGVYSPTSGQTAEGGHSIAIIGYNDAEDSWICKNSWGTGWGDNGYFKIARATTTPETEMGKWVFEMWGVSLVNSAPVLQSIGDQTTKEGVELTLQLQASDPDGNTLTYSASTLPEGATFDASAGKLTWTPTYTQSGLYTIKFTISDGLASVSETIIITVLNVKKGKGRF